MGEHRKKKGKDGSEQRHKGKHRGSPRASSDPSKCEHPNKKSSSWHEGGYQHECPDCKFSWWTP